MTTFPIYFLRSAVVQSAYGNFIHSLILEFVASTYFCTNKYTNYFATSIINSVHMFYCVRRSHITVLPPVRQGTNKASFCDKSDKIVDYFYAIYLSNFICHYDCPPQMCAWDKILIWKWIAMSIQFNLLYRNNSMLQAILHHYFVNTCIVWFRCDDGEKHVTKS